jgi:uncharacterized membrane protein SpoIIM required for sporulation
MDIDRFIAKNAPAWYRLEQLSARARRSGTRNLTPAEVDELVGLYQRASSHLSHARVSYRDPGLTLKLTTLVTQAGGVIYRGRSRPGTAFKDFFVWRFPAAVYQSGRFVAASAALLLLPALMVGFWLVGSGQALDVAFDEEFREVILEEEFEDYYSNDSAANFGTMVTVNNIQVGITAFVGGILGGVPTAFILAFNGASLGAVAGAMDSIGQLDKFFGLVTPHGLLELTAVVIAGAAGLRMGWSIIAPGEDRQRGEAFGAEARRAFVILVGVTIAFICAGFIEGFVTGRVDNTWLRVGVGVVAEALFVTWIVVQGRRATAAGLTGDLDELDRGWEELALARERLA